MAWRLEAVPKESETWAFLCDVLRVSNASELGVGRDVIVKEKYKNLAPVFGWKITAPSRLAKFNIAKQEVAENIDSLKKFAGMPAVETKFDKSASSYNLDASVNEKFLLHGTKPETLLTILQNGLNERFSRGVFGNGVYLAEDAEKCDQYCTPDAGLKESLEDLQSRLYDGCRLEHPGRVFYTIVCRVILGFTVYTKDGETNMYPPNQGVFANSDKRELAIIPGSSPPIHYHTMIVECGPAKESFKLTRHREIVAFHSERIYPEYVIAYQRTSLATLPAAAKPIVHATSFLESSPSASATTGSPDARIPGAVGAMDKAVDIRQSASFVATVSVVVEPADIDVPAEKSKLQLVEWAVQIAELCGSVLAQLNRLASDPRNDEECQLVRPKIEQMIAAAREARGTADTVLVNEIVTSLQFLVQVLKQCHTTLTHAEKDVIWKCARELLPLIGDLQLLTAGSMLRSKVEVSRCASLPSVDSKDSPFLAMQQERGKWLHVRRQKRDEARRLRSGLEQDSDRGIGAGCIQFLSRHTPLFNKKYSIRAQLAVGTIGGSVIALALFIIIACAVTFSLGSQTKSTVTASLTSNAMNNLLTVSLELANAMDSRFKLVSDRMTMTIAEQAKVLITQGVSSTGSYPQTLLRQFDSYADFGFVANCAKGSAPLGCPPDYGPLDARSRVTNTGQSGSLLDSAVYIYDSGQQGGSSPSDWTNYLQKGGGALNASIQATAVMDLDYQLFYSRGTDATLFFYTAVKIPIGSSGQYVAMRRTFPGLSLQSNLLYDPTTRPWFTNAPEGDIAFYGPSQETFTGKFVIYFSTKRSLGVNYGNTVLVSSSLVTLEEVESLISGTSYYKSGFAVLATSTGQVIFWGDSSAGISITSATQLGVADPGLASFNLKGGSGATEYIKQSPGRGQGEKWLVSYVPFFLCSSSSSSTLTPALVLLVLARSREVLSTTPKMQTEIDSSSTTVLVTVLVGAAIVFLAVCVCVALITMIISPPLRFLKKTSAVIVKAAAFDPEDGAGRYTYVAKGLPAMTPTERAMKRQSELGRLVVYFYSMVTKIGAAEQAKLEQPRFPDNPFQGQQDSISAGRFEDIAASRIMSKKSGQYFTPREAQEARYEELIEAETMEEELSRSSLAARCLGSFRSLRFMAGFVATLLIVGLAVIAFVAISTLQNQGSHWLDETGTYVVTEELRNLNRIAVAKSIFSASFFDGTQMTGMILAQFLTLLLNGTLTHANWASNPLLPANYALDCGGCNSASTIPQCNYYAAFTSSCTQTIDATFAQQHSGYYSPSDTGCIGSSGCGTTFNSNLTRLTAIMDLRTQSIFHARNNLDFLQFALESNSFTRNYKYTHKRYSQPSSCQANTFPATLSIASRYQYCSNLLSQCASGTYPPYDPKCRVWYQYALNANDPNSIVFIPPRTASTGFLDVTASTMITSDGTSTGTLQGVLNVNALAQTLANSVNSLRILTTGYAFVISSQNPTVVIVHPMLLDVSVCVSKIEGVPAGLRCVETGFSDSEWASFQANVLPLLSAGYTGAYLKGGSEWKISSSPLPTNSTYYTMVVTVPTSEVLQVVTDVNTNVKKAIDTENAAFITIIVLVGFFNIMLLFLLVRSMDSAIKELVAACKVIAEGDLADVTLPPPSYASSADMLSLLEAFSSMLLAFKFGSDAFTRGDLHRARVVFADAILLFENICNDRGCGIAYNNAAAVDMALGKFEDAAAGYMLSISIAQANLQATHAVVCAQPLGKVASGAQSDQIEKAKRLAIKTLSNRIGNYAGLLIESGSQSEDPISLLEYAQNLDEDIAYIYGWTVKQTLMASYYQKQGEIPSAERCLRTAIERVRISLSSAAGADVAELSAAFQLAYYSLARHFADQCEGDSAKKMKVNVNALKARACNLLADALATHAQHEPRTTGKCISLLLKLTDSEPEKAAMTSLATTLGIPLGTAAAGKKRVAFLLDYSGSMAGSKISAAVSALAAVFDEHIRDTDEVFLAIFNNNFQVIFDLSEKRENMDSKRRAIQSLNRPGGGTKFFDSVSSALERLRRDATPGATNWIVALTDGDDNQSSMGREQLERNLKEATKLLSGLIVIAVGQDVQPEPLRKLANATAKGCLLLADGSAQSISEAFAKAAEMIESHVMLEDF